VIDNDYRKERDGEKCKVNVKLEYEKQRVKLDKEKGELFRAWFFWIFTLLDFTCVTQKQLSFWQTFFFSFMQDFCK